MTGLGMCEEEDRTDMCKHQTEKRKCFSLMENERLHGNDHNKCLVAVVTVVCHHATAAAAFLSQSTTISSTIQLGLITGHRLYQIVT